MVNRSCVNQAFPSFHGVIGSCQKMGDLFASIQKVARTDISVLLIGESGTGKERVASAIHQESSRRDKPFVVINCPAIPETLLESELFGHQKGAFTGAYQKNVGRIISAHGGTLFLDELGELSLGVQAKFLRFLQDHIVEPVGGHEQVWVDVRVIAATNRNLTKAIRDGRFREDLYYRLSGVTLTIPPLRERGEDISMLAHCFLHSCCTGKKKVEGFSKEALKAIEAYPWPGNVREMENRVRQAMIMAEGSEITLGDLDIPSSIAHNGNGLKHARKSFEAAIIQETLILCKWNMAKTARKLRISRMTLYGLVKQLNINRQCRRASDLP